MNRMTTATTLSRWIAALGFAAAALVGLPAHAQSTDAEVLKIDKAQQKITLKHGEIKNLDMPPMTMVFRAQDAAMLDAVKVGDKVKFDADKVGGQYTVVKLAPTK
jgi:Cu(I)/Ag(I) efflux system periplasmic protein CusF